MGDIENKKSFANIFFKITVVFVTIGLFLFLSEVILKNRYGLGNPVLYDINSLYGYRPIPNQDVVRFYKKRIKLNNLALRADSDWDERVDDKVLFMGDSVTYGGSYIDNTELFSTLAVEDLGTYMSGNAGVNGWGVENVCALVVDGNFMPAQIYVSVFLENDFYRGVTRFGGLSYFAKKPTLALEEIAVHVLKKVMNAIRIGSSFRRDKGTTEIVAEKAVIKLKRMDEMLKNRGFEHIIFITPTRAQVYFDESKMVFLKKMFKKHGLEVIYIVDELDSHKIKEGNGIFHDKVHLEKKGHEVWAKIIRENLLEKGVFLIEK